MTAMEVFKMVRETILLKRAAECPHEWEPLNEREEQCKLCAGIATPEGKKNLEAMSRRWKGAGA